MHRALGRRLVTCQQHGPTAALSVGELTAGPGKLTENFKAPSSPGNYFFRCDAHPDQMTGTFVVK